MSDVRYYMIDSYGRSRINAISDDAAIQWLKNYKYARPGSKIVKETREMIYEE